MVDGLMWETGLRKENKMIKPILKLRNINKAFSGVEVLHDISIDIMQGEVLGVLGENGAGKSTLLKIISGIYTASSGEVYIDDQRVDIQTPVNAKALGIAMIPQEFNLVESLNVFENIFLGIELKNTALLDKKSMRDKTREILNSLETDLHPDSLIEDLSVAEKQMVEIAKALAYDSRILIMDEPTTVLTATEVDMLFRLVEKLKQRGVTILFISHKLKEIKQLCDRLVILRDGYLVSIDDVRKIDEPTMARKMVGRELNQIFPDKIIAPANTTLEVNHLCDGHFLEDISFKLNKGEVLGFAGLIGAGRTEIFESLIGMRPYTSADIRINNKAITIKTPRDAIKNKIAYLSEDRQGKGLIMNFNVPENITLISINKYIKGFIQRKKERAKAKEYVTQFDIKTASLDTHLINLSGGNQQKVYLSKWMDTLPEILIMDEPTRGIDINTKKEVYHFIQSLTHKGISVIVISSEMEEVIGLCHRVLVMRAGRIVGELHGDDINEEKIMFLAAGVNAASQQATSAAI